MDHSELFKRMGCHESSHKPKHERLHLRTGGRAKHMEHEKKESMHHEKMEHERREHKDMGGMTKKAPIAYPSRSPKAMKSMLGGMGGRRMAEPEMDDERDEMKHGGHAHKGHKKHHREHHGFGGDVGERLKGFGVMLKRKRRGGGVKHEHHKHQEE